MAKFYIQIEEITVEPDTEAKWQSNVNADGTSGYVRPPEGNMRREKRTVYTQTVDGLDLAALVRTINTPAVQS